MTYFRARDRTIIGAERFHFRVRDGIGWFPLAMATRQNGVGRWGPPGEETYTGWGLGPTLFGCYRVKPHGLLVSVSCTHYWASTPDLSTWWSSRALQGTRGPGEILSWEGLPA